MADNIHLPAVDQRLLGTEAAARYLGIKPWSVRALVSTGVLRAVRLPSPTGRRGRPTTRLLLDVLDLDVLIQQSKQAQPEPVSPELHHARVARMQAARRRRAAS